MVFGYNAAIVDTQYSNIVLNIFGDLFDVLPSLGYATVSSAEKATWKDYLFNSHCSSLVKLTADLGELYAGHTTWSNYTTMLRQFKSYSFAFSPTVTTSGVPTPRSNWYCGHHWSHGFNWSGCTESQHQSLTAHCDYWWCPTPRSNPTGTVATTDIFGCLCKSSHIREKHESFAFSENLLLVCS
eukprot:gene4090-4770_t